MAYDTKTWRCGAYELTFDRPRIMGILNVTPDSFSDGGEHLDTKAAIAAGLAMLDAGADIIDVGGESTRPGFTPVDPDVEAERVIPVVRELVKHGAIVSIDTRNVEVAKACVRLGASIVNDVTGFTDPKMVEFVAGDTCNNCGLIVVHAGDLSEGRRTHTAVQLDTSAAALAAERAAAAERAKQEKPARKGPFSFFQSQLASEPNGSAAGAKAADKDAASASKGGAAPAAVAAAPVSPGIKGDRLAATMNAPARPAGGSNVMRRFTLPDSGPIMRRVMGFLSDQARTLTRAGVRPERICLDPGAGFGKTAEEDIVIQRSTAKMASLGYPLMCAVSRKRFVGTVSGIAEAPERDAATFGVCLAALEQGANIVRVHDAAGFAEFLSGYWSVAHEQPRRAFVALGSNMGDRLQNIRAARDLIAQIPLTCVSHCSRIYESEPAYELHQQPFANAVVEIKTELAPTVLLDEIMKVEQQVGRKREGAKPNGPRVIDCDLLWMEGEIHGGDKLRLPHPKLGERDFVLIPLEDLVHDPARFFRFEGVEVLPPEQRVGHVVGELGSL